MEERLQLFTIDDDNSLETVIADFVAAGTDTSSATPIGHVINHLVSLGVRSVVVQQNVQDPDFLAEHATYYSRWSYRIPRFCPRVHFFSVTPGSDDVLEALDEFEACEGAYLGFVTLRPTVMSPVGPTFVRTLPGRMFVRSRDRFPVNLAGCRFEVDATPFMQQDNAVGACAQASIWMALRTQRWKEGRSAFSPAEITSAATRFMVSGRTLPNRDGLRIEQMTEAVRAAGYSPHVIALRRREAVVSRSDWGPGEYQEICSTLYPYIESGIPVLLALMYSAAGHAVVAIGHGWSADVDCYSREQLQDTEVVDASCWAHPFIVHNDNSGPYMELPPGPCECYSLADALFAIPLLSADILVDGDEARATCLNLLKNVISLPKVRGQIALPERLVVRTRLLPRSEFRREVREEALSPEVKRFYRRKWLPSHIWVLELNGAARYHEAPAEGIRRLGEVILEPSADPKEGHFLGIRLGSELMRQQDGESPDLLIDRDAFSGDIRFFILTAT